MELVGAIARDQAVRIDDGDPSGQALLGLAGGCAISAAAAAAGGYVRERQRVRRLGG